MDAERINEKTVKLRTAQDIVELTLIKEALKGAGIDCMEVPFVDAAYDGIFVPAKGFSDVFVFESQLEQAEKIIAALLMEDSKSKEEEQT
ncbi:MAG TPA: DUF2007 domain-containing protein [Candidatus Sumerlaeota bacterium]|nr:MAG: hypothetical protein BWY12_01804 [candidate division BRC1 bacterium ADurb.Bin183]HOE63043.1 DUF2007 domain-containing protein [Candidatus Sumerlaeota bacterium]HRR31182.1 DUF2007 domain-containing protein [Candidatus Sumerlaeia bacterium]HON49529.1 DUF2007 domain-containing protein [Candidatus Sumerlaeota bacterium]HOR64680.1 DUF2007 domain-containing protein [Candidatus Sumerlaeota bacterium]